MNDLAYGYREAGQLDQALPLFEETLAPQRPSSDPTTPTLLASMANLAMGYQSAGKLDRALPLSEETVALMKTKLGPDHPRTLISMNNLAGLYRETSAAGQVGPAVRSGVEVQEKTLGRDHPSTLLTVATWEELQGRRPADGSDPTARRSLSGLRKNSHATLGGGPLIDAYTKAGENAKLADLSREHFAEARKRCPRTAPQLAGLLAQIGLSLLHRRNGRGRPLLRECLAIREQMSPTTGGPLTRSRCSAACCWAKRNSAKPNRCSWRVTRG